MKHNEERLTREREEAWIGDAVLALFVREWILREQCALDGEKFIRFTSNDFLRGIGNPTQVEARIGCVYRDEGMAEAYKYIEDNLLPVFLGQERARAQRIRNGELKG
ncbi:MAG: hypothetical protein CMP26_08905 [Roseibacillus sp.]|nr:hypothetical protein [Roseibacillus sp.]